MTSSPKEIARCLLRDLRNPQEAIRYAERIAHYSTIPQMKRDYTEAAQIIKREKESNASSTTPSPA